MVTVPLVVGASIRTAKGEQRMTNNKTTTNPFKERLNNHRDVIINHIKSIHQTKHIKVMTNKDDSLNRGKHFGAHILVDKSYYYITFSRKDEYGEHYFSINENLLKSLKHCNEDWHLLLINNGKVRTFDAKSIVENAKLFNETTYKVPLSAETSCKEADYRYAYNNETECKVDFTFLGNVRYSKSFDMHKKPITISEPTLRFRRTYRSQIEAYVDLTGAKVENGKVVGKPMSNAAYLKSYKQFLRDIRDNKLHLISDKGTSFQVSVVAEAVDTKQLAANVSTSLLVSNQNQTNRDVDTSVPENCNKGNVGGAARLDKQLNNIAEKLVEKESTKYTPAEIQKTIVKFGSNRNMLTAYIESLTEKGLQKEAAYAAKVFEAINNIDFN